MNTNTLTPIDPTFPADPIINSVVLSAAEKQAIEDSALLECLAEQQNTEGHRCNAIGANMAAGICFKRHQHLMDIARRIRAAAGLRS